MVQATAEDSAVEFPVLMFNGERQINIGKIAINPTIDYESFRAMLKHIIGGSYSNLTTYLVESRRASDNVQPKILITRKADFTALVQQKNAYFLVVMRRTKRRKISNRIGLKLSPEDLFDYSFEHREIMTQVPESGKVEYLLHQLEMERAKKKNCDLKRELKRDFDTDGSDLCASFFPSVAEAYPAVERPMRRAACKECTFAMAWGWKPVFHLCVYDDVVEGFFRSPAGPISRSR